MKRPQISGARHGARARMGAKVTAGQIVGAEAGVVFRNRYEVECRDRHGNLKWSEDITNLVTNAGLNDVLDKYFKGSSYTAGWYVGLKGTGSIAAGDTMASHAGWSEITAYSESDRPALTLGSVSSQSLDNSASKAAFSINDDATVAGAFVASDDTKGGSSGLLYGAANFASSRGVEDGDSLSVQITLTTASG